MRVEEATVAAARQAAKDGEIRLGFEATEKMLNVVVKSAVHTEIRADPWAPPPLAARAPPAPSPGKAAGAGGRGGGGATHRFKRASGAVRLHLGDRVGAVRLLRRLSSARGSGE